MSTHSTSTLSGELTPAAYAPPPEAAGKEADKPHSPQSQPQAFLSTAPGYTQTPSGTGHVAATSNTQRTARAASSNAAAAPEAEVIDSAKATQEQPLLDSLAASFRQAQAVIDQRPTFSQAVSKALFPDAKPPVGLDGVYVNEYTEIYEGSFNDYGGTATLRRRLRASHKLTDVLSETLKTGQPPSFLNNAETYGLFTQPNAVDGNAALDGATPAEFKNRLDQLARHPASALQNNTDDYFNKPGTSASGILAGTSPKAHLRLNRIAQFRAEAELRTIDGTLKPEHRALIDKILAHPNPNAEERKQTTTPAMYGISVVTSGAPLPGLTLPGAFLITDNNPVSAKTTGVFYSPARGIQPFGSLQEFRDDIWKQHRQAQLNALSDEDAAKLPTLLDGLHFNLNQLDGDVFNYSVETQLVRHRSDTAYAFKQATEKGITDPNELDMVGRNLSEPLIASFDADQIETRRDAALIEHNRPAWWQNASEKDLAQLDQLERDSKRKADAFHDLMQEQAPTLHDYAVWRIKDSLQAKYPYTDIDPDAIRVQSYANQPGRPLPEPPVSLTQFVLNNVKTKWDLLPNAKLSPQWRASFTDRKGKKITLLQKELRSLARDLNVGQGHQDLLRQRMLSNEGNDLRQGWKDSYAAQMRADAKAAQLSGALDDEGYRQVMALLDYPERLGEPNDPLQVFYLRIGNSRGGRTGASVEGPLLIAKSKAKLNDRLLLYTPNAPDGIDFKTYLKGIYNLKRDSRFKQEAWKTYFKNHVSENMRTFLDKQFERGYDIFDRGGIQAPSLRKLEDTLYEAHVRRQLADTQNLSKSNQQLDAETAADLSLLAMDIVTSAIDIGGPGLALLKSLLRLLNPFKAIMNLKHLPNFAAIVQKGAKRPIAPMASTIPNRPITLLRGAIPKRAIAGSALHQAAADHRMNIVELPGHQQSYLAPKMPDQPNGHYLLRTIDPDNENQLVSTGIIAKPELRNGKEVWQPKVVRIVAAGSNQSTAGPGLGAIGAAPSTSQPGNQAALMAKFNNAPTYKARRVAFKELYNDFFDNIPTSTYPPRPTIPSLGKNATTRDLINAVYSYSRGLVLGEYHNNVSAIKFLYDNLVNLKRIGVNTIYVEGFDGRWITKLRTKKERLTVDSNWDRKQYGWPYTAGHLFEKAEELGIRIIGIDKNIYTIHGASTTNRLKAMNYWAKTNILMDQSSNPGKWLALVGQSHMKTSGKASVSGLSEILGAIGVEIHPSPKGKPTSISTPGAGWREPGHVQNGDFRIDLNVDDVATGRRPVPG